MFYKIVKADSIAGQTMDLIISVETNGIYISSIYLDDFKLQTSQTP
jgi:hypothetical protein